MVGLEDVVKILIAGKTILYPTDTVWGIGCDATNKKAVQKVFEIKRRNERKSLVILVDGLEMLKKYVDAIPRRALTILKDADKPTTIIYNHPKGLASNVIGEDNTVAVRIVQHDFCKSLIAQLGKPIVSTSANISNEATPMSFKEINPTILDDVDYVVNLHQDRTTTQASRIIKILENGELQILRD